MSVAIIPMAKDLGWSNTDRGLVSSAFFWGYAATQVPAGWVSTSLGGARVLMAGVALWSVGTLMAPPAARMSITALCVSRVIVGLGEGLAPSSATNVLARIIPEAQRARAVRQPRPAQGLDGHAEPRGHVHKRQKEPVVARADALADPGAVMVEPADAVVAHGAVRRARRPVVRARGAPL